jgi:hypothetical protein
MMAYYRGLVCAFVKRKDYVVVAVVVLCLCADGEGGNATQPLRSNAFAKEMTEKKKQSGAAAMDVTPSHRNATPGCQWV